MTTYIRNGAVICLTVALFGCGGTTSPTSVGTLTPTAYAPVMQTAQPTSIGTVRPSAALTTPPTVTTSPVPSVPNTATPLSWPGGIKTYPAGSAGNNLGYLEYLPFEYVSESLSPLLVYLDDTQGGGDGTDADLHKLLDRGIPRMMSAGTWHGGEPFVVLAPQMPTATANRHCEFGAVLDKFLSYATTKYRVDPKRMYLTGISCGGIAVWDYLANKSRLNKFAAVVPIASAPFPAVEVAGCEIAQTPIWAFHGALDDLIPVHYIEDAEALMRACSDPGPQDLKVTIYPDAGHSTNNPWDRTYDGSAGNNIYEWMLSHHA